MQHLNDHYLLLSAGEQGNQAVRTCFQREYTVNLVPMAEKEVLSTRVLGVGWRVGRIGTYDRLSGED